MALSEAELERRRRAQRALELREKQEWEIEREALREARRAEREKLEAERAELEATADQLVAKHFSEG